MKEHFFHILLGTLALLLLLLISVNIQLSMMRVAFTTQIYGANELWAGHSGSLRFTAMMDDGFSFEEDIAAEVRLIYAEDGQDFLLFKGENRLGDTLEVNFSVPPRLGKAMIAATIFTGSGEEFVTLPVEVINEPKEKPLSLLPPERSLPLNKEEKRCCFPEIAPGQKLYAYPESGLLAPQAKNTIYLFSPSLAAEAAELLRLTVPMTIIRPDSFGVAAISLNPGIVPTFTLEIEDNRDGASEELKLPLEVAPAQMFLTLSQYRAKAGEKITATLNTLRRQETIFLDIWYKNILLESRAVSIKNGQGSHSFTIPQDAAGLIFVQIYRPFVNPGETQDMRAIWVNNAPDDESFFALIALLNKAGGGQDPLLSYLVDKKPLVPHHKGEEPLKLILSRLYREDPGAPLLLDSGPAKRAAFALAQKESREKLHYAYIVTGILLLILLIFVIVTHLKKTKKALRSALDECPELIEDGAGPPEISLMPPKVAFILVIMALLLLLFTAGILLANLKWTIW